MPREKQRYSEEFRAQVIGRMRAGASVRKLSWELKVAKSVLYNWRNEAQKVLGGRRYEGEEQRKEREIREQQAQIRELQAKVGQQTMELDFFRGALRRVGAKIPAGGNAGKSRSGLRSAAGVSRKAE